MRDAGRQSQRRLNLRARLEEQGHSVEGFALGLSGDRDYPWACSLEHLADIIYEYTKRDDMAGALPLAGINGSYVPLLEDEYDRLMSLIAAKVPDEA